MSTDTMDNSSFSYPKSVNIECIFQAAQVNESLHTHLISKLAQIFSKTHVKPFTDSYIRCLKKIFVDVQDTETSCASIALLFAVKFLIFLIDEDSLKYETPSKNVIHFWTGVFYFLKKKHDIADAHIRKRICQFVARFMLLMSPDAELDCKICEIIVDMMKDRIKDRVPIVRIQAILAVYRLQDNADANCPVTKTLLNCIETDSAAEVRKVALSKISLKHKSTVRVLIDRIDDVSEKVRKDVYVVFSKLHPLYFNAEERERLLYTGFYDNSEKVRSVVKNQLLPSWFKRMDNDFIKFLHMFDLIFGSPVLITKIIMSLIETMPKEERRKTIDVWLDQTYAIPLEQLTCENAFYWRCYVFHESGLVLEKEDYEWQATKSYDAHAVGLLPDLSVFCEYMNRFHRSMSKGNEGDEKWKRKEQEFAFVQLIEMCKVYDYADEVGRKHLQVLCLNLLQEIQIKMLRPVVQLYFNLRTDLSESICKVANEVNNLLHPSDSESESMDIDEDADGTCAKTRRATLTPEQENSLKFKMAKLEIRLEELNDLQEDAIRAQDFAKAELLKNDITSVREQISLLKDSFYCKPVSVCYDSTEIANPVMEDDTDLVMEDDELKIPNPLEAIGPDIILRCVTIVRETLNLSLIKYLTPELRALLQDFVIFACKSDDHVIAPLATELLGSFCLRDKNLAKEYFITIFSLCGNSDICVSALRVIFDFLAIFGADTFKITNLDDVEHEKSESFKGSTNSISTVSGDQETEIDDDSISGYAFISTLINLLDDEYIEARYTVVHGLCRLMAVGKLRSPKVLSRLIIIWFHPTSREAIEIRSCLNFFFPFFVKCKWALPIFEDAFIPTMEILFEAPSHNPISDVDQKAVIKVLCDITNPNYVGEEDKPSDNNIHYNLAVLICKSIIEMDSLNHITVLVKALDYLNLLNINPSTFTTVNNLLEKIIKNFKKKRYSKLVTDTQKFKTKLVAMVQKNRDSLI